MSDFKYRITNDEDYKVMIKKLDFTKENKRLVKMYKENPSKEIMGEILTLNEGLVLNIIEMYKGILQYMEIDDLYTEGMLGLMKAVEKYDVDGTYAFSTYASFWIKQCCSRYIKTHNRMIRIPEYLYEYIKAINKYISDNDCDIKEACKKLGFNENIILMCQVVMMHISSLNSSVYSDDEQVDEYINTINDENAESMEDFFAREDMKERVNSAINLLSEREQFIVRMRYGLIDGQPHTLDDICKPLGISRERVRVINNGALKKLSRMKAIRGFAPENMAVNS